MKLASFIMLSVVVTCLSGSVWANGKLYNPEYSLEFCNDISDGTSPEDYDDSVDVQEIEEPCKLAMPRRVNTEELNELLPKEIIGAAKTFLLDKTYVKTAAISKDDVLNALLESPSEPRSYHYFAWINDKKFIDFHSFMTIDEVRDFLMMHEGKNYTFFQLNNANPVENKAADFIEGCLLMEMLEPEELDDYSIS
ncbi:hypothetical protein IWQ61_009918 [Dispira simplex]|nr:hypothetical protein IWQ61_009918 [Dispira simplex]